MTNLVDTIHGLGTFMTFTRALEMSALALTLREPGAYTVFAPTDAAFAQMHEDMLEDLFEERDDLSRVVKYHVVMGRYKAADLLDVIFLKTMEGQRLTIRSSPSAPGKGHNSSQVLVSPPERCDSSWEVDLLPHWLIDRSYASSCLILIIFSSIS